MFLLLRYPALFQSGPEPEDQIKFFPITCFREKDFFVITVNALIRFSIQITHCLKSQSGTTSSEVKQSYRSLTVPLFRNVYPCMHPQVTIPCAPAITCLQHIPSFNKTRYIFFHLKTWYFLHLTVPILSDFFYSLT